MNSLGQVLIDRLRAGRVLPILAIERVEDAVPLARALHRAGIYVIEVVLRTNHALHAIQAIVSEVPDVVVGVGTVRTADDFAAGERAGARFAVSPGLTPDLARAALDRRLPLIPGVATASEAMAAADLGFELLKLFPAEAAGGRALLRALAGPLPDLLFCPTGGVNASTVASYLALSNVACAGGSWLAPVELVAARDWDAIEAHAREQLENLAAVSAG